MRSLKEQLMKSVCTGFIFAGSLIVGAIEVEAQSSVSVNKLLPACRSFASGTGDATYTQGMCAGIIFGLDALGSGTMYCAPRGATMMQAAQIVVNYAERIPARWHEPMPGIALEAFRQAWPCKR
jgi:hypothetical protein